MANWMELTQGYPGVNLGPESNNWRSAWSSGGPVSPYQLNWSTGVPRLPLLQQRVQTPPPPMVPMHRGDGDYFKPAKINNDDVCKNLIVNYLPPTFGDRELFQLFVPYGPLHSVKVMRDPVSGRSSGFGFVNFMEADFAEQARKNLNGFQVAHNKILKVSYARPSTANLKDTKLFVTNLPQGCTLEEVNVVFGKYGQIIQSNLVNCKYTGRQLRKAFVRYAYHDQALSAQMGLTHFLFPRANEPILVRFAVDFMKEATTCDKLPMIQSPPMTGGYQSWASSINQ